MKDFNKMHTVVSRRSCKQVILDICVYTKVSFGPKAFFSTIRLDVLNSNLYEVLFERL